MKYMELMTKRVEQKIRSLLPELFSIAIDGWSESNTHFVCMYAVAPLQNDCGYKTYLLGFSPFESELSQNADEHARYCEFVLELFGKSFENVAAIL